jgi:hypothetical protein
MLNLTQTLDAGGARALVLEETRNRRPCGDFFQADARTRAGDPFITSNGASGTFQLESAC